MLMASSTIHSRIPQWSVVVFPAFKYLHVVKIITGGELFVLLEREGIFTEDAAKR